MTAMVSGWMTPTREIRTKDASTAEKETMRSTFHTDQSSATVKTKIEAAAGTEEVAQGLPPFIEYEARRLFDVGKHTERNGEFEMGMDNPYRDGLHAFLEEYGIDAIEAIRKLLPFQSPTVQAATIMYLGDTNAPRTLSDRLNLAVAYLSSRYPQVRDAAGLALIDLDDVRAVPNLTIAIENEPLRSLKQYLEQARSHLKRPR